MGTMRNHNNLCLYTLIPLSKSKLWILKRELDVQARAICLTLCPTSNRFCNMIGRPILGLSRTAEVAVVHRDPNKLHFISRKNHLQEEKDQKSDKVR